MKLLQAFVSLLILSTCAFAGDLQRILSDAQTAMIRGDYETAERNYKLAYQMDPHSVVAIAGMKQVALQKGKDGGGAAVEKQLSTLILPQVQLKEATFAEALDFLKKKTTEISGGKQTANFVVQPGVDQAAKITLSLTNIPLTEALRYLAGLAGSKIEYQKYAIMFKPANAP